MAVRRHAGGRCGIRAVTVLRRTAAGCRVRRLLEDHVTVRPAHPQRGDAGRPRATGGVPRDRLGVHPERGARKVDLLVGFAEVQARHQGPALDAEHRLDQPGNARRLVQVPRAGLHGAQRAVSRPRSASCGRRGGESLGQRGHFDGVAQCGARPVRLDVADVCRVDARSLQRGPYDIGLPAGARRGEADLRIAVVIDRRSLDHGNDPVAVRHRILQTLESDDATAVAEERAGGVRVESAGVPIAGEDHAFLMEVAGFLGNNNVHTARQGHAALTVDQAPARQVHGHQRRGTRRLDRYAGPPQVQGVGHPGGQVVAVIAELELELLQVGLGQRLPVSVAEMRCQVVEQVRAQPRPREDPHVRGSGAAGGVPGVLKSLPCALQEDPLLGIQQVCLLRAEAEERGIEPVDVRQHGARRHEVGVRSQAAVALSPSAARQGPNGLHTVDEVPPVRLDIRCPGEPPGHPDDRDVSAAAPPRRGQTPRVRRRRTGGGARLAVTTWLRPGAVQICGEVPDGRVTQQVDHGDVPVQTRGEFLPDLHQQQGGAAKVEEAVFDGQFVQSQRRPPDVHEQLLGRGHRGQHRRGCQPLEGVRWLQPSAVRLAAGCERQRGEQAVRLRQQQRWETRGQEFMEHPSSSARVQLRAGHHVGDQASLPVDVMRDHRRVSDRRVSEQQGLDLAGLDPYAVHLHLGVDPAQQLQRPVGAAAGQIPGAVHPAAAVRVGHEPLGREFRLRQVPRRHSGSRDA